MGLKFEKLSGSRLGFLRTGVMAASLRDCGTEPEERDELMICVMKGEITGRQVFINGEGMGSKEQVGVLSPVKSLVRCTGEMNVNCES